MAAVEFRNSVDNFGKEPRMVEAENGLRRRQEMVLVNAARKAFDERRPIDALSLLERVSTFWQANLITLMSIICSPQPEQVKTWASVLFNKHLGLCETPIELVHPALWVLNPKRMWHLPMEFKTRIDARRKSLEPDWDGVWQNPGLGEANVSLVILSKRPEEVFDAEHCLVGASQTRDWNPWFARYRALGGSFENPRYLKLRIARVVARDRVPSAEAKEMLQKFVEVGDIGEARAFLRHITPTKRSPTGRDPNWEFAKYALLVYCSWERLELDSSDWGHIAKSAMYLRHRMIQRIAQRGLAGIERPPSTHRVFEELNAINGEIRVTEDAKKDIGPQGNPIWQSVYRQLPVDGNAKRILVAYSKSEMEAS